jgi:photosystem II stability/assembly factor-like uncharacterized protein
LQSLRWRLIGPFRGGRVVAVAGHPSDPMTFYFGACDGGVWKSTNGGQTWRNVSDGFFRTAAVGAVAVAASDPNVVYAGMGEACIRSNVSHGDGVYRSTDGGATWRHLGLEDTRHIARVRVDPRDPDRVYVAALGHAFGPNAMRGIFRTRDGGATWEQVLFVDEETGACDLSMDPLNPRILYAAMWHGRRTPHGLTSGNTAGGLWRSTDGGDTWTRLSGRGGFPDGLVGRIGVSASGARAGLVYATVEAAEGGVFRSEDGGEHWERVSQEAALRQRPWYYEHIFAHPTEPDTVWVLNVEAWRSTDGGRTFHAVSTPHGDNHDLWIDPARPERMIEGNDGGAIVTFDGGRTWSSLMNQPTAQFYHVTTDTAFPYRVYGAQQDNTTLCGPSRSHRAAITNGDWHAVGGGESGYIAVRPDDPDIVYAGSYMYLSRFDRRTRQERPILPWPEDTLGQGAGEARYRFQWTFPVLLSPHDPNVLYAAGNVVFRSTDEGQSWQVISPDLTRRDPERMVASGGPITKDNTGAEYYCTIFALAESPVKPGLLWAGSDDGLVHVSEDGGASWRNVTPPADLLPEWSLVSVIEPSPHDAAVAYLAATRYKLDDLRPILLRTDDGGATWRSIAAGLPGDEPTRVVRADPARRGVLYLGTERGVYVSLDDGGSWRPLGEGLPVVPVHDLRVHADDLVAGTHGRSFWILDDLGPVREMAGAGTEGGLYLFRPRDTVRLEPDWGFSRREGRAGHLHMDQATAAWERPPAEAEGEPVPVRFLDAGENPPTGVLFTYRLSPEEAEGPVTLTILDAAGTVVRRFTNAAPPKEPKDDADAWRREPRLPARPGLNRFAWDMRYPGAEHLPRGVYWAGTKNGPMAPPGRYEAELTAGERSVRVPFALVPDPRLSVPEADLRARFELALRVRDAISDAHRAVRTIHALRQRAQGWADRARAAGRGEEVEGARKALVDALAPIEEALIQTKARHSEDLLNYPSRLSDKLSSLLLAVEAADARPTDAMYALFDHLAGQVAEQRRSLSQALERHLPAFNAAVAALALAPVAADEAV